MKSQNEPYPDRVNWQFKTANEMIKQILIINFKKKYTLQKPHRRFSNNDIKITL